MAAGFPVKANYATGDVLSAANMNDLSGTVNYIDPTGKTNGYVLTRNSSAAGGLEWAAVSAGGGKVLQVVQGTYSTSTTIATTTYTDTGLSLSITPSSSSSKVLVLINQQAQISRLSAEQGSGIQILRGATTIFTQGASRYGTLAFGVAGATEVNLNSTISLNYLDSPATTSATTYKVQMAPYTTGATGTVTAQGSSTTSIITLMEIGA
jgi:hypothetical protein